MTTNLLEAPPLFTDEPLSVLYSIRHELKQNIRLVGKGRLYILKDVFQSNLRKVERVIGQRSLKKEAI